MSKQIKYVIPYTHLTRPGSRVVKASASGAGDNDQEKKLIEKSRECHNHKQPTPDTKRKRKRTTTNTYKTNKQMHEKHKDQLPFPQARWSQC